MLSCGLVKTFTVIISQDMWLSAPSPCRSSPTNNRLRDGWEWEWCPELYLYS